MALRPWSKLTRLANLQVSVEKSGKSAKVIIPSLSIDDIDRTGNISIWRIQRLLTAVRLAAYHIPNPQSGSTFLEYDKMTSEVYTFLASAKTEVARDLYDLPDALTPTPLEATVRLGYIGNSSLNSVATLIDRNTGKELAWNVNQVVTVSKTTRKPTPIPDWWREKYAGTVIQHGERLIVPQVQVPDSSFAHQMTTAWSDVDSYKHITYVAYIRYCLDAAMTGVCSRHYSKFDEDILRYQVKKLELLYKGECVAGDILDIASWENKENPYLLHFDVKKKGATIFQNSMEFFEPISVTP